MTANIAPLLLVGLTRKLLVGKEFQFGEDSDEVECLCSSPYIDKFHFCDYNLRCGFIFVYRKVGQSRVFITSVYKYPIRAALSYLLRTCKGDSIYGTVECRLLQSNLPFIRQVFSNRVLRAGRIKMQFSDNKIDDHVFDIWCTTPSMQLFSTTKDDVCSRGYTQQQLLSPMRSLVIHLHGNPDEELNTAAVFMATELHNFFNSASSRRDEVFNGFTPSEIRNWQKGVGSIYATDERVNEYLTYKYKNRGFPGFFVSAQSLLLQICSRATATNNFRNRNCRMQEVIVGAVIFFVIDMTSTRGQRSQNTSNDSDFCKFQHVKILVRYLFLNG